MTIGTALPANGPASASRLAALWVVWGVAGLFGWTLNQVWSASNTPRDNILAFLASSAVVVGIGISASYPLARAIPARHLMLLAGTAAWIMSSALGWATSVKMGGALAGLATAVPFVLLRDQAATWIRGAVVYGAAAVGIAGGYALPWSDSIVGGATLPAVGGSIALCAFARVSRFPNRVGLTVANMVGWNIVWVVAWAIVYGSWRIELLPLLPATEVFLAIAAGGMVAWMTGAHTAHQRWWHVVGWWTVAGGISVLIGHVGAIPADQLVGAVGFDVVDSVEPATYAIGTGLGALFAFTRTLEGR